MAPRNDSLKSVDPRRGFKPEAHQPQFDPDLDVDGAGRTNGDRAERAAAAVHAWLDEDKPDTLANGATDYTTHLQDLLCDLQHLADREKIDFARVYATAQGCFREESGR